MRDTILLIFTVASLTFFISVYLRLGGILPGSYLISFATLINSSFSSSLYPSISAFFTNISSSAGNEQTWYVFCYCSFSCPCSTKISCVPCSSAWPCLFSLSSIISWTFSWNSTLLFLRSNFLLISSVFISVSHIFVRNCLAWSANFCSVTGKAPISSHIFFILCLYFLFVGSLHIQHSIKILFTAFSHFIIHFVWSIAWWRPAETGSSTLCMPGATPSQLVVPVSLTQLFLIPCFDISLYLRFCFMFPPTSVFIKTPSLERLPPKVEEFFLRMSIIPSILYFYIKLSIFLCLGSRSERKILFLLLSLLLLLTVCSCHVTSVFQSECTLYSCLNVKEHLARSRREIWSLSDCNWTRTQNHLVRKWTHNDLAKLAEIAECSFAN